MFPGMGADPKQMMALMKQFGIKSEELAVSRVVIEKPDGKKIVVEEPQVIQVEMQGKKSFQVSGEVREEALKGGGEGRGAEAGGQEGGETEREAKNEEDVELVVLQTGASTEEAKKALEKTGGDLAEAILLLKKD